MEFYIITPDVLIGANKEGRPLNTLEKEKEESSSK